MIQTAVLTLNPTDPDSDVMARAAEILRGGGLVAFPTETVYGVGANALDPAAVQKIFTAKGRPAVNPLIVHVAQLDDALELVTEWSASAQRLAERFWPGPLTLVLPRSSKIPDVVTAGGPTVALRVPAHPVALALLRARRLPLAAPSANRSTRLSPTRAEHVLHDLRGYVDLILDAGPTPGGLESTVLDLTSTPPRLLRPGLVTPAQIEAVVGPIERAGGTVPNAKDVPLRSPGMSGRHYAPRAPLECVAGDGWTRVAQLCTQGVRVGWLTFDAADRDAPGAIEKVLMPPEASAYAAQLYAALHELDRRGVERIVVALPPLTEEWLAVHDRLARASAQ